MNDVFIVKRFISAISRVCSFSLSYLKNLIYEHDIKAWNVEDDLQHLHEGHFTQRQQESLQIAPSNLDNCRIILLSASAPSVFETL